MKKNFSSLNLRSASGQCGKSDNITFLNEFKDKDLKKIKSS